MKIDPYKNKEGYLKWKEKALKGLSEISSENTQILLQYLNDMEIGINTGIGATKGSRSFIRLKSLRDKLIFIMKKAKVSYNLDKITKIKEEQIHLIFTNMLNGTTLKANGKKYIGVRDYMKIFKAFWHWHQKVNRKNGIEIKDITEDLDCEQGKPDWVYLTEEQVKKIAESAKPNYKVLIWFLFDTGIRAPTELINIKVSDFHNDFKELNIRDEISKTFGRKIKLMLSNNLIKDYVKGNSLKQEDYIFAITPCMVNRYLKRLSLKLFGDKESPAGQKYSELTMYDFRHNSCCYWLPRYKSESALKYRFGWKKSDRIHYYSELLGMRDTISEDDMLVDITKAEIERKLDRSEKEKELMQDEIKDLRLQVAQIGQLTNKLYQEMIVKERPIIVSEGGFIE